MNITTLTTPSDVDCMARQLQSCNNFRILSCRGTLRSRIPYRPARLHPLLAPIAEASLHSNPSGGGSTSPRCISSEMRN